MSFSAGKEGGKTVRAAGGVAFDMKTGTLVQIHTSVLNTTGNKWSEIFRHSEGSCGALRARHVQVMAERRSRACSGAAATTQSQTYNDLSLLLS
jgi:hypothetical protein